MNEHQTLPSPIERKYDKKGYNYGKKKNRTTFERAKKYEDVDQFA